jgi:hypothetical protein
MILVFMGEQYGIQSLYTLPEQLLAKIRTGIN